MDVTFLMGFGTGACLIICLWCIAEASKIRNQFEESRNEY